MVWSSRSIIFHNKQNGNIVYGRLETENISISSSQIPNTFHHHQCILTSENLKLSIKT